jgi:ABC-type antimicrobial peptide transport system permease subunit
MLRNYLKIALRTIWKHKGYSFINIAGLAVGLACALFILLWVQDELSYDRFHADAKNLYRVEEDQKGGEGVFHVNVTPYPLGPGLKAEIPDIKDAARTTNPGTLLFRYGEKAFFESRVRAVDPSFLTMFTFPLLRGEPKETALGRPYTLVMTDETARKYFGSEDPVGKVLTVNNKYSFTVTAVMKKAPANSSFKPDLLVPFEFMKEIGEWSESWDSNSILTWVELHRQSSVPAVNAKMTRLVWERTRQQIKADQAEWKEIEGNPDALKRFNDEANATLFMLMPLVDLNLYSYFGFSRSNQSIQYVYTFTAIALFVLLIACINFMNLATARSASRAREVGLRKVVGAVRRSIAAQFYGESVLTTVLAAGLAVGLVLLLLPAFNTVAAKQIAASTLLGWKFLAGILAVTALTGLVSGSYPAMLLSSFQPAKVLKGRLAAGGRGALFRKSLVVVQFSLSIFLLIGMGTVYRQIDFMRTKKLGYDKEHLLYLPLRGDAAKAYGTLKSELLRNPRVMAVTGTREPPAFIGSNSWGARWDGKDPNRRVLIGFGFSDFDFAETMKIDVVAGRPFSKAFPADQGRSFMVNEEVPKLMGLKPAEAIGKSFHFLDVDGTIIGVMKNYHYQSVRYAIEPLALLARPETVNYAVIRLRAGDVPAGIEAVKGVWRATNPLYPFEYRFFDEDFDQAYRADQRMGTILNYFTAIAVLIACLGLFGLASFTAEQRTKEIGVRKVLGASVGGVIVLFSKEFAKWVAIANIIAWPVGYLVMKNWLQGFAFRVPLPWWLFAVAGVGALVIAMVTVSVQAVRSALADPVNALKYE